MDGLVLVDFDDTLVETAPAFQKAREALFGRLQELGFPWEESHRVHHDEVDPRMLELHGMGPYRMEPSFRETYLTLCRKTGRTPNPVETDGCGRLGRDFMGAPKVMKGCLEALERLGELVPTVIFSQAAQGEYQMGRIRDSGVTQILGEDRIRITPRKTAESFREALRRFGIADSGSATMIGNSVRSDINPALTAGAGAILVEPYEMWQYDNVAPVSQAFHRFPSFPEAVEFYLAASGTRNPGSSPEFRPGKSEWTGGSNGNT